MRETKVSGGMDDVMDGMAGDAMDGTVSKASGAQGDELKEKLILAKTHDRCVSGKPRLTLVMLHGIASDSSTFESTWEYLEEREALRDVRVVAFDLLGAGKSLSTDELNYNYDEQETALHNALLALKNGGDAPMVLLGHSMGTLIATKYAYDHKHAAKHLILVSPPVYRPEDLENPAFRRATKMFEDAVAVKNREMVESKAFRNAMDKIVMNKHNYERLCKLETPATLIYGELDQFIAPFNIPKVLKENAGLNAVRTPGRHGMSRDKYIKLTKILTEIMEQR